MFTTPRDSVFVLLDNAPLLSRVTRACPRDDKFKAIKHQAPASPEVGAGA